MRKLKKYQVWGYKENAKTQESCIIEIFDYTLKKAKMNFENIGIIMTSKVYLKK